MSLLVQIILIIILIFLLSRVVSSIRKGRYLLGSAVIPIKRLIVALRVFEQSNPDAYIKIKSIDSFDYIEIYKRQDDISWWFECFIPSKNKKFIISNWMVKEIHDNIKSALGYTPLTEENGIYLGSNIENISEIIFQYFNKVYKCNKESKIRIVFVKTRVEKSTIKDIIVELKYS